MQGGKMNHGSFIIQIYAWAIYAYELSAWSYYPWLKFLEAFHFAGGGGISSDKHKSLQAIALSLLGKLSLQHYDVAKKVIPAFGKLLASDPDPAVRINATIIISDLYQR